MTSPALIVLGGLPGVGKTSIARELVKRMPSAYLRVDVIEQSLKTVAALKDVGSAGYVVAYELARSNLALGITVVADCVNPLPVTRGAWRSVATDGSFRLLEVEIVCSNLAEHRNRINGRSTDISDFVLPTWDDVLKHEYESWVTPRLVIDTALISAGDAARSILESLPSNAPTAD